MNGRTIRYAAVGLGILALLIVLSWFALREPPTQPAGTAAKIADVSAQIRVTPPTLPAEDTTRESVALPAVDATPTNAAVFYRQAFVLYDALSTEQKSFLTDPKTNIDLSAEAELCEKIRPICDLMHQAVALTNCDWGVEKPYTIDTKLPHLQKARWLSRAANWSANRCHNGDPTGAVADLVAASRLGHQLDSPFFIGFLVDMAIQGLVMETVREHASEWTVTGDQHLTDILADADYEAGFSASLSLEADWLNQTADKLSALPAEETLSNLNAIAKAMGLRDQTAELQAMGPAQGLAYLRQAAEAVKEYGNTLPLSPDDYRQWLEGIARTNPVAQLATSIYMPAGDKVQLAIITTTMTAAGLAVIQGGPAALQSYLDPTTGKPFVYLQTADGFELESSYQNNGQPLRLKFK